MKILPYETFFFISNSPRNFNSWAGSIIRTFSGFDIAVIMYLIRHETKFNYPILKFFLPNALCTFFLVGAFTRMTEKNSSSYFHVKTALCHTHTFFEKIRYKNKFCPKNYNFFLLTLNLSRDNNKKFAILTNGNKLNKSLNSSQENINKVSLRFLRA